MQETIIPLWKEWQSEASLTVTSFDDNDTPRPALLAVPGGGYCNVCRDHEGIPVAERFAQLGFRTFILHYRIAPAHHFPAPQQDILRAIRLIRYNKDNWKIIPDQITVCGFSAGGHLCASAGTIWQDIPVEINDEADKCSSRPDAMILSYSVISAGKYGHHPSLKNLLGSSYTKEKMKFSLEKRVTKETAPAFIWHTMEDATVNVENSVLMEKEMRKAGVPHELHLYPCGYHGIRFGMGRKDIAQWPEQAQAFLRDTLLFDLPE